MENIFEKGCLVQLSVSQWGAARKIDKGKLAEMTSSPDWVRATKKLVDPESLKPISKIANEALVSNRSKPAVSHQGSGLHPKGSDLQG